MKEENIFYVYAYLDPMKPGKYVYGEYSFDYEPFYVGKGKEDRKTKHLVPSLLKKNSYKNNKIKKIRKATGNNPIILILESNITEKTALDLEANAVFVIGRYDLQKGPLANLKDEGEKQTGYKHTDEAKNKISASESGKNHYFFGKKHTDETKKKMREAKLGEKSHNFNKKLPEWQKNILIEAHKKQIIQFDLNGNFIKEWDSIKNASEKNKISSSAISRCLLKKGKTSGGYIWYYKSDFINGDFTKKLSLQIVQEAKTRNIIYKGIKVIQLSKNNETINMWDTISKASKVLNISKTSIIRVCKGKQKTAGKFIWKYVN